MPFIVLALSVAVLFHLSPRLCLSTAGCSPRPMPFIVLCLLLSCFTFHLGFVHPLQDVALGINAFHCPLPICCPVPGGSLYSLLCPLAILCSVVPLISSLSIGCHSLQCLVHLHSCCMPGAFPFWLSVVFYNVIVLVANDGKTALSWLPYHAAWNGLPRLAHSHAQSSATNTSCGSTVLGTPKSVGMNGQIDWQAQQISHLVCSLVGQRCSEV